MASSGRLIPRKKGLKPQKSPRFSRGGAKPMHASHVQLPRRNKPPRGVRPS